MDSEKGDKGNKRDKHDKFYERMITFDQETAEKLHNISLMASELIYAEIEKLDLGEEEKIIAHYYVAKHYYDSIQKVMTEVGIGGMMVNIKKDE